MILSAPDASCRHQKQFLKRMLALLLTKMDLNPNLY